MFMMRSLPSSVMSGVVMMACARASTVSDHSPIHPTPAGTVTVSGRVTSTVGIALADAAISIEGFDQEGRTDAQGKYIISNVRAGHLTLVVRHEGYTTARTEAKLSTKSGDGGRNRIDVILFRTDETEAFLARIRSDSALLEKVGFRARQAAVRDAYFVTPEDIASIQPRTIADLFKHVPVLLDNPVVPTQYRTAPTCTITYVNGIVRRRGYGSNINGLVPVRHVVAAEVYPPRQSPPPPFNSGSSLECATVAVWTRTWLNSTALGPTVTPTFPQK